MVFRERKRAFLLAMALCIIAAGGAVLFLWGTAPHGIGIRSDSVDYLWSAKNLARGVGLGTLDAFGRFRPLNHFPPLYPVLLAGFELAKIDGMEGARWLGALLTSALILLSGAILSRLTSRSFWFPIIGILVLFFIRSLWETSLYAMTEPLYLVCSLAGFLCLDNYAGAFQRRPLLAASILLGLSFFARYIGISSVAAGILFILSQSGRAVKQRVRDSLVMASIGILPMVAWMGRNLALTGTATNRDLQFVPISLPEWKAAFEALMTWVEPIRAGFKPNPANLIVFLIALGMSFLWLRRKGTEAEPTRTRLGWLLSLYAACYLVLTIFARLWADPTIPLNEDRILFPFLSCAFFLAVSGLHRLMGEARRRSPALAALLAGICVTVAWGYIRANSSTTAPYIRPVLHSRTDGLGLQFRTYLAAGFEAAVARLPQDEIIFTDNTQRFYFYTNRPSSYIGELTQSDIRVLQEQLAQSDIAIVFFEPSLEVQQALMEELPELAVTYSDNSGRIIYTGEKTP
jgi:hypothetical protein